MRLYFADLDLTRLIEDFDKLISVASEKKEIFYWSKISRQLIKSASMTDNIMLLVKEGVIPTKGIILLENKGVHLKNLVYIGENILSTIVTEYLSK